MIETKESFKNIRSIVTTKGLSGIYIGPSALSIGLSDGQLKPGMDRTEPEIVSAIQTILNEAKMAKIFAGIHCATAEYAAKSISWGFDMVTGNSDARLLAEVATRTVKNTRGLIEKI